MAVRWQRWQKGGRGGRKVATWSGFLSCVIRNRGAGNERQQRNKRKLNREWQKKKEKAGGLFRYIHYTYYNILGIICQVLMADISILYVSEPDNPPNLNVRDWITSLLSSVHNPPSVNPSISALTVGYQFGASIRLLVGG